MQQANKGVHVRVIGSGLSPFVQRVMLAVHHKRIELELEPPAGGGSRSAAHLAHNPMGKVPVLVDGDLVLPESEVIVAYLEDIKPEPSLFPGPPAARARARLLARVLDVYGPPSFRPFLDNESAGIEQTLSRIRTCLGHLEQLWRPSGGPQATGEGFSAADCALIPFFTIFQTLPAPFRVMELVSEHAQVATWWQLAQATEPAELARTTLREAITALFAQK